MWWEVCFLVDRVRVRVRLHLQHTGCPQLWDWETLGCWPGLFLLSGPSPAAPSARPVHPAAAGRKQRRSSASTKTCFMFSILAANNFPPIITTEFCSWKHEIFYFFSNGTCTCLSVFSRFWGSVSPLDLAMLWFCSWALSQECRDTTWSWCCWYRSRRPDKRPPSSVDWTSRREVFNNPD